MHGKSLLNLCFCYFKYWPTCFFYFNWVLFGKFSEAYKSKNDISLTTFIQNDHDRKVKNKTQTNKNVLQLLFEKSIGRRSSNRNYRIYLLVELHPNCSLNICRWTLSYIGHFFLKKLFCIKTMITYTVNNVLLMQSNCERTYKKLSKLQD